VTTAKKKCLVTRKRKESQRAVSVATLTTEEDIQRSLYYDKYKTTKEVSCLFTEFGRGGTSPFLVIFEIWVVRVL
jgi:hypothetical protein